MVQQKGFTLAEVLIALGLLGVIAAFTIPKMLESMANQKSKAIALETASILTSTFEQYKQDHGEPTAGTTINEIMAYLNGLPDTTSNIDFLPNVPMAPSPFGPPGSFSCQPSYGSICMRIPNGAIIFWHPLISFGGHDPNNPSGPLMTTGPVGPLNEVYIFVDPDGHFGGDGINDGPSKSIQFYIYSTGLLRTAGTIKPLTRDATSMHAPAPSWDPSWFSWN